MGYRSAPAVNPGLPPCPACMAGRPPATCSTCFSRLRTGLRVPRTPLGMACYLHNTILSMMFQHDRERGHSFSSVRGFAAHTHWDQLGLPVNEWLRRTLINEKRHHTGVGNPLQSRLPCRRALWTQVDLKLPFTTIVANGRDGWRPWKNAFAEDGGPTSAVGCGRVCELIQALRPGLPAAAVRHQ